MDEKEKDALDEDVLSEDGEITEDGDGTEDYAEEDDTVGEDEEENFDESSDDGDDESDADDGDIEIADEENEDGEEPEKDSPVQSGAEARDEEKESLRRELARLKSRSKDALKTLGIETDDVEDGLAQLAAESSGVSKEEYIKKAEENRKNEELIRAARLAEFEKMAASDLAIIQAEYPEAKKYKSVKEFPNFKRFGELRDGGASPAEAYIATHGKTAIKSASSAARQKALNDGKDHLRSVVPKASKDTGVGMTKKELLQYKEMFPDATDKEIRSLYKRARG